MTRLNHLCLDYELSMTDEVFTDPAEPTDDWVDVRMTNPEVGEWDVDLVIVDGQVNYVDLRIRPDLLTGFVECLMDDIGDERALTLLQELVERADIDLHPPVED